MRFNSGRPSEKAYQRINMDSGLGSLDSSVRRKDSLLNNAKLKAAVMCPLLKDRRNDYGNGEEAEKAGLGLGVLPLVNLLAG